MLVIIIGIALNCIILCACMIISVNQQHPNHLTVEWAEGRRGVELRGIKDKHGMQPKCYPSVIMLGDPKTRVIMHHIFFRVLRPWYMRNAFPTVILPYFSIATNSVPRESRRHTRYICVLLVDIY